MNSSEDIKSWKDLGFINQAKHPIEDIANLSVRYVARPVVLDGNDQFVLSYSAKLDAHTLPGGGIEMDETIQQATIRECREETGYDVEVFVPLGYIKVCKGSVEDQDYLSVSFSYFVRTIGEQKELQLTEGEINLQITTKSFTYEQAIATLKADVARNGNTHSERSIVFIEEAKKYLDHLK